MKKYLIAGLVLGLVIGGSFLGLKTVKALPPYITFTSTAAATTTVNYMTAGTATTTLALYDLSNYDTDETVDSNQIFIQYTASTSAGILNWRFEFTNGTNCDITVPTSCNWYEEDSVINPALAVANARWDHSSTTMTHVWQPGSTVASTSLKAIIVPPVAAKYKRVQFFVPIGSVNGAVYVQNGSKRLGTF